MPAVLSTLGASAALFFGGLGMSLFMGPHILYDNLWTFAGKINTTGMEESVVNFTTQLVQILGTDEKETRVAVENLYRYYLKGFVPYVAHNLLVVPWLLFPLQFIGPFRRAYPKAHRYLGRVLVFSIAPAAITGAWLGVYSSYGLLATVPGFILAGYSLYLTYKGWTSIRKKDYNEHQKRMTQLTLFLGSIPLSRLSISVTWKFSKMLPANKEAPVWVLMDQNVPTGLWLALAAGYFLSDWYGRRFEGVVGAGKGAQDLEKGNGGLAMKDGGHELSDSKVDANLKPSKPAVPPFIPPTFTDSPKSPFISPTSAPSSIAPPQPTPLTDDRIPFITPSAELRIADANAKMAATPVWDSEAEIKG